MHTGLPKAKGLYDPVNEHDNCGIGFVAHIKGQKLHDIIERGLQVLENMDHRGATSADNKTGDGAGILMQLPDQYIREVLKVNIPAAGLYGTGLIFLPQNRKMTDRRKWTRQKSRAGKHGVDRRCRSLRDD